MRKILAASIFLALSCISSSAQNLKIVGSSGDWAVGVGRMEFALNTNKENIRILSPEFDLCNAFTINGPSKFIISVFPGGKTTFVSVYDSRWNWKWKDRNLTIKSGSAMIILESTYLGKRIDGGPDSNRQLQDIAKQSSGLEVVDDKGRLLARFSSKGFSNMLKKAIDCAKRL